MCFPYLNLVTKLEEVKCSICPNGLAAVNGFCCPLGSFPYMGVCKTVAEVKTAIANDNTTTTNTQLSLKDLAHRLES